MFQLTTRSACAGPASVPAVTTRDRATDSRRLAGVRNGSGAIGTPQQGCGTTTGIPGAPGWGARGLGWGECWGGIWTGKVYRPPAGRGQPNRAPDSGPRG